MELSTFTVRLRGCFYYLVTITGAQRKKVGGRLASIGEFGSQNLGLYNIIYKSSLYFSWG